ncbi:hypothetical protein [Chelativorans sp. AA-79]|uniref:hypothetical protein n=1 Tax=Chelativorans sp. AA-79 TaxID=3028735 RepID=UPI0023F7B81A|nr:hypothetical protein [Chelativorans sp. AA-79]WEX10333.1 hypothetical protein PVE73_05065 [Chelativorans sp. AA-79]
MNDRPANLPSLMTGAPVSAIIPTNLEETWRVSTMIVEAGIAPVSLTGKPPADNAEHEVWQRWGKRATSAVATTIMAGAELGLPPMVSLRSFTVIGNKPALYGDGIVNVVRRSRKSEFIKSGFIANASDKFLASIGIDEGQIEQMKTVEDRSIGYCWARRSDTGEEKTEIFSITDAKRAGLWDDRETRRGKVWKNGQQVWDDVPNDSTWHRYSPRMQKWRAEGYCLRDLFADVLGGITDEFEAREIASHNGYAIDQQPEEPRRAITPPSPSSPPSPSIPPSPGNVVDADVMDEREIVTETGESTDAIMGDEFSAADYFEELESAMGGAMDAETVEEVWTNLDPEGTFAHDSDDTNLDIAHKIKARRLTQLHPVNAG